MGSPLAGRTSRLFPITPSWPQHFYSPWKGVWPGQGSCLQWRQLHRGLTPEGCLLAALLEAGGLCTLPFCKGTWAEFHSIQQKGMFCKINQRRENAYDFGKLGIRGGNETRGPFLSALLIEMVFMKWVFGWIRRYDFFKDPLSFKPSSPKSSKCVVCNYSKYLNFCHSSCKHLLTPWKIHSTVVAGVGSPQRKCFKEKKYLMDV